MLIQGVALQGDRSPSAPGPKTHGRKEPLGRLLIRGQVWPRGWSPLLLRGGAQEDLAFWVGSLYTCPGKGALALGSRCSDLTAAI